jgi:hypothetical protein
MSAIAIPNGTATLRDKLGSERHHRLLEAAFMAASSAMSKVQAAGVTEEMSDEERTEVMNAVPLTMAEAASMLDLQDAAIVAFLERWSLPRPLPTIDNVSDLDRDLYQALAVATRDLASSAITERTSFDPTPDPKAVGDIGTSNNSDGLYVVEEVAMSPETLLNYGGSTVSAL